METKKEPLVRVSNLTKVYREGETERVVFSGMNLDLHPGELVVLLGRSGSGKSTLLNLISGIDEATTGKIFFGEVELTALSENDRTLFRRESIGIIFQSFNLIPTLTVAENMLLPMELNGRLSEERRAKALGVLEEVGLLNRQDSYPDRLSGGEQQRVALARALAHEPLLILADEPTGNLDLKTADQVMQILHRLIHDEKRTMLIATHDRDILNLADRILSLKEGVLTEVKIQDIAGL
ncbi:ABC transporter ATP-binding protein [bacterium]|nr:ABC transporter ATP-binding protein [bacterium]